jgi:hypothetical protein
VIAAFARHAIREGIRDFGGQVLEAFGVQTALIRGGLEPRARLASRFHDIVLSLLGGVRHRLARCANGTLFDLSRREDRGHRRSSREARQGDHQRLLAQHTVEPTFH